MHSRAIMLTLGTALAAALTGCATPAGSGARSDQPSSPVQPAPVATPERTDAGTASAIISPAPGAAPASAPSAPAPGALPAQPGTPAPAADATPHEPGDGSASHHEAPADRDLRISQEVRAGLTRDAHLARDSRNVQVATVNGVVTLTGTVTSDADRGALRSQAERVSGVVRVEDQLVVR